MQARTFVMLASIKSDVLEIAVFSFSLRICELHVKNSPSRHFAGLFKAWCSASFQAANNSGMLASTAVMVSSSGTSIFTNLSTKMAALT